MLCLSVSGCNPATVAARVWHSRRGSIPGEMVKRMDRNENGQIDPDEMEGRARGFLESMARDNNLDLSQADRQRQAARHHAQGRLQGGPGGSSGSTERFVVEQIRPAPAVKTFGVSTSDRHADGARFRPTDGGEPTIGIRSARSTTRA